MRPPALKNQDCWTPEGPRQEAPQGSAEGGVAWPTQPGSNDRPRPITSPLGLEL